MHASLSQVSFSMCHGIDNHVDMSDYVIPLVFVLLLSNNQSANENDVCVCVCDCVLFSLFQRLQATTIPMSLPK